MVSMDAHVLAAPSTRSDERPIGVEWVSWACTPRVRAVTTLCLFLVVHVHDHIRRERGDPDDDFSSTLSLEQRRADRVRRMTRATNNAVLSVLLASANLVQIGAKLVAAAVLPHGDVSLADPQTLLCAVASLTADQRSSPTCIVRIRSFAARQHQPTSSRYCKAIARRLAGSWSYRQASQTGCGDPQHAAWAAGNLGPRHLPEQRIGRACARWPRP